ncbi:unnamed protein product [Diabrotica balteata]|uniref:THAP-type domain-containing protein n=1 Tax=Diabrotica balteata TaxID=107213 RepID=A0A9N9X972_DIABA|nr:unnamed protein product [Diabrotica balteata]
MVSKCCVLGCRNTSQKAQLHTFPKDEKIWSMWIKNIGREDLKNKTIDHLRRSYRICNIHFDDNQKYIGSRYKSTIKQDAVPTLFLPIIKNGLRSKLRLLAYSGTESVAKLTPKAKKFYRIAKDLRKTAKRLDFKCLNLKKELRRVEKVMESGDFLAQSINKATYDFIKCQLRCQKFQPKGRRYSLDEKILFLSFLKQSPKGYKLFRKIFAAPSRKTLTNLLQNIPFATGINETIMASLKNSTKGMSVKEKYCSILFDEISIDPGLQYNKKEGAIYGFEDYGDYEYNRPIIADKALVFMARGIFKKWKQPIAYYISESGMKGHLLCLKIKEVIRACRNSDLLPITIICDQYSANKKAIKLLYEENCKQPHQFGFLIDGVEVIPLYDPPHLLKGIRNNFFNKSVKFKWRKNIEVATWAHINQLYDLEDKDYDYKLCPKLTESHVKNLKKMKVSIAAQTLSNTVAAAMKKLASSQLNCLPAEAESTAEFILFMDKVFDSVNGAGTFNKNGKRLRMAVTKKSEHYTFWTEAIQVFESIKFEERGKQTVPPSVLNWIHTLRGMRYLWELFQKKNIKYFCPNFLNQDPLENFFGRIRSHGARYINPNATAFIHSFKSLIIMDFTSVHSPGFNCKDDNLNALDSLKHFINCEPISKNEPIKIPDIQFSEFTPNNQIDILQKGCLRYIAGFVAKKILRKFKSCGCCMTDLLGDGSNAEDFFINAKSYSIKSLMAPNSKYGELFEKIIFILQQIVPKVCHYKNLKKILFGIMYNECKSFTFICEKHQILKHILNYVISFHLLIYAKNITKILQGKLKVKSGCNDPIKNYAQKKFYSHKKYVNTLKIINNCLPLKII